MPKIILDYSSDTNEEEQIKIRFEGTNRAYEEEIETLYDTFRENLINLIYTKRKENIKAINPIEIEVAFYEKPKS